MHTTAPLPTPWRPSPLIVLSIALHLAALVAIVADPPGWRAPAVVIVANHMLLTAIGLWPRSTLLGANWTRLPDAARLRNEVAITFDDGPDPEVTPKILELLEAHRVHATFFCIGSRVAAHPELCRDMIRRGHAIENHSTTHRWHFSLLGFRGMERELEGGQRAVTTATGQAPLFFRAPAGLRNPLLEAALARAGLKLATWTRRGFDTRDRDADAVLRRLVRNLGRGDILAIHDGNAARTKSGEPVVLVVLPKLIAAIRDAGLRPVTLRSAL